LECLSDGYGNDSSNLDNSNTLITTGSGYLPVVPHKAVAEVSKIGNL
jgi:hypothetical protein